MRVWRHLPSGELDRGTKTFSANGCTANSAGTVEFLQGCYMILVVPFERKQISVLVFVGFFAGKVMTDGLPGNCSRRWINVSLITNKMLVYIAWQINVKSCLSFPWVHWVLYMCDVISKQIWKINMALRYLPAFWRIWFGIFETCLPKQDSHI